MLSFLILLTSFNYSFCNLCYDDLGCFHMDYPWISAFRPVPPPAHPKVINTKLFLFTGDYPTVRYKIELRPEITIPHGVDLRRIRSNVFIIHGYMNNANTSWMERMKNAYFRRRTANIFLVDWMGGAVTLNYLQSVSDARVVGAELARFLQYCIRKYQIRLKRVHLIGHSLGAHIAGYCGKILDGKIGRISGLDPAKPGFEDCDPRVRIAKGDAQFIDILHSSGKAVVFGGMGMVLPIGDVDVYANGGLSQPGCPVNRDNLNLNFAYLEDFGKISIFSLGNIIVCDHMRSIEYFIEALENTECSFWAKKAFPLNVTIRPMSGFIIPLTPIMSPLTRCSVQTCTLLGIDAPKYPARGNFVIKTNAIKPFCQPDEQTKHIMYPPAGL